MRVLVTGGGGFLGRAVVKSLSKLNISILPVSRKDIIGLEKVNSYYDSPVADILR